MSRFVRLFIWVDSNESIYPLRSAAPKLVKHDIDLRMHGRAWFFAVEGRFPQLPFASECSRSSITSSDGEGRLSLTAWAAKDRRTTPLQGTVSHPVAHVIWCTASICGASICAEWISTQALPQLITLMSQSMTACVNHVFHWWIWWTNHDFYFPTMVFIHVAFARMHETSTNVTQIPWEHPANEAGR